MSTAAALTSSSTGRTEERTAPGDVGAAGGTRSLKYQTAITISPNAELAYCSTWHSGPLYEPIVTGALSAATRCTSQVSLWVKESHSRWVHTPTRMAIPAYSHSRGRHSGASAVRHSQRARADSSAVGGARSTNTASSARLLCAGKAVTE